MWGMIFGAIGLYLQAIIEERLSTILVGQNDQISVDEFGDIIIEVGG